MKELAEHIKDKTEIHALKPAESSQQYQYSMIVQKGQKCFEYDYLRFTMKEASYETIEADFSGKVSRKVVMRPNCGYAIAINKKNALKKLQKMSRVKLISL